MANHWTGRKHTEESKAKMRGRISSMKGKKHSEESKKKISVKNKGRKATLGYKHTEETKQKIRLKAVGRKLSAEHKLAISLGGKGRIVTEDTRRKLSENRKGEKCHFWKGGISKKDRLLRESLDSKLWREKVFSRDDWTCQNCGLRGKYLEAHHIYPWCEYPELRFEVENGITFCVDCHRIYDERRK